MSRFDALIGFVSINKRNHPRYTNYLTYAPVTLRDCHAGCFQPSHAVHIDKAWIEDTSTRISRHSTTISKGRWRAKSRHAENARFVGEEQRGIEVGFRQAEGEGEGARGE